jgi:hypothetical protein
MHCSRSIYINRNSPDHSENWHNDNNFLDCPKGQIRNTDGRHSGDLKRILDADLANFFWHLNALLPSVAQHLQSELTGTLCFHLAATHR